ncbi:hypothetical protein AKO1_014927 [Acrasis kona]|uniref:GSKIP domain-containing protein n=1 Tax=Acrasis kona TaxID=1008807 RepID=A0AAW2Z2P1_9EUKA
MINCEEVEDALNDVRSRVFRCDYHAVRGGADIVINITTIDHIELLIEYNVSNGYILKNVQSNEEQYDTLHNLLLDNNQSYKDLFVGDLNSKLMSLL